jgi:hypothetical protein
MGYPYPIQKKFIRGFVRIPGVVLEASGGSTPQISPRASPLEILGILYFDRYFKKNGIYYIEHLILCSREYGI